MNGQINPLFPNDMTKKDIQNLLIVSVCTVVVAYNFATGGLPWIVGKWRSWTNSANALKEIESKKRNIISEDINKNDQRETNIGSKPRKHQRFNRSLMFKVSTGDEPESDADAQTLSANKSSTLKSKYTKRVRF